MVNSSSSKLNFQMLQKYDYLVIEMNILIRTLFSHSFEYFLPIPTVQLIFYTVVSTQNRIRKQARSLLLGYLCPGGSGGEEGRKMSNEQIHKRMLLDFGKHCEETKARQ